MGMILMWRSELCPSVFLKNKISIRKINVTNRLSYTPKNHKYYVNKMTPDVVDFFVRKEVESIIYVKEPVGEPVSRLRKWWLLSNISLHFTCARKKLTIKSILQSSHASSLHAEIYDP